MPTFIGHAISGFAVGSLVPSEKDSARIALLSACCAMAPDLDGIAFKIGIPYGHWLGHRGFTHSLSFAAVIASLALVSMRRAKLSGNKRLLLWSAFFSSAVLHDLLDAMTNGGMGVAFFSPFDMNRYFFPWQPIEVSPLSIKRFLSGRGAAVILSEFLWVMLPSFLAVGSLYWWKKRRTGDVRH